MTPLAAAIIAHPPTCCRPTQSKDIFSHPRLRSADSLLTVCPHFPPISPCPPPFFLPLLYQKWPPVAPPDSLPSCCLPRPPIKPLPSQASLVQRPRDSWGRAPLGSNTDVHTDVHPRERVPHRGKGNAVIRTRHVFTLCV